MLSLLTLLAMLLASLFVVHPLIELDDSPGVQSPSVLALSPESL